LTAGEESRDVAAPKGVPAKRTTLEEIRQRMQEVEAMLLRRLSTRQVQDVLAKRWNVTQRQVRDYIGKVRAAWRQDAVTLAPEERERRLLARDHMRASLNDAYSRALGRTEVVRDAKGNPVVDPGTGKPLLREVPDLVNGLRALGLLMDLDAVGADRKVVIEHSGRVEGAAMPAALVFADRTPDELRHYLTHGAWPAPNGKASAAPAGNGAGT
jgi:hypothetical protein